MVATGGFLRIPARRWADLAERSGSAIVGRLLFFGFFRKSRFEDPPGDGRAVQRGLTAIGIVFSLGFSRKSFPVDPPGGGATWRKVLTSIEMVFLFIFAFFLFGNVAPEIRPEMGGPVGKA